MITANRHYATPSSRRMQALLSITTIAVSAFFYMLNLPTLADNNKSSAAQPKVLELDMSKQSDEYWKKKLDPHTYAVTRCSKTEPAFANKYWNNHADGIYRCSNCGAKLFDSNKKFDSGTGWPSFTQSESGAVSTRVDRSDGMVRDEIICKHCGAHLGHVFNDGPQEAGGLRYCVNSASLNFQADKHK